MPMHRLLGVLAAFSLFAAIVMACSSSSDDSNNNGSDASTGTNDAAVSTDVGTGSETSAQQPDASPYQKLPCTVRIGSGSGTIDLVDAGGNPGDVICVKAGTYTGGAIENLSDRTVQNDQGQVVITGVVTVGNLTNVTFSGSGDDPTPYGFQLSGANASMVLDGPNVNLTVHDFESLNAGIFLDAGHTNLMWANGNDGGVDAGYGTGFVLYQSKIDRIHLKSSGELFQGNYGAPSTFLNFISDVEMSNIIVEDSAAQAQTVVNGGGMFHLDVHDWTITSKNDVVVGSTDDRDTGVIFLVGSGTFSHLHRDGGWGWLVRGFAAELGPNPGEIHCENNVDLNTEYYGTCELRNTDDPTYLIPGTISTVDIFVKNNFSAHKGDIKGSYTTAIALIANLNAGTTATVTGNTECDDANDYGDTNAMHSFVVNGTIVQSGNQQLTSCAGLKDPFTGAALAP